MIANPSATQRAAHDDRSDSGATHPPNPRGNAAAARRLVEEGFNGGNLGVLDELLDDSFVEHQSLPEGIPRTKAAVRAIILALRTGFSDLHLEIEAMDAVEDRVWLRIRATGTQDGPFMGIPPSGRSLSVTVFDMVRFRGGRMVEHWGVPDNLAVMEQLGVGPSQE